MIKRRKREKMGTRKSAVVRSPRHLQFVRGHECLIAAKHECSGKVEAHHLKDGSDHALSRKASDHFAVPLCSRAHELGHRKGWKWFEATFGVDMHKSAAWLANRSPALKRMVPA